jgi:hypothetical protein
LLVALSIPRYLNDHERSAFYESLGLNTTEFNQHVIIETNKTTERIFPAVPDVEHPDFFVRMDRLVQLNKKVSGQPAEGGVEHQAWLVLLLLMLLLLLMPLARSSTPRVAWSCATAHTASTWLAFRLTLVLFCRTMCDRLLACIIFAADLSLLLLEHPQVIEVGRSDLPGPLKALARAPYVERMVAEIFQIFIMKPIDCGSFDLQDNQGQLVY